MGALKYADMYLQLGYNCVIYDLGGHAESILKEPERYRGYVEEFLKKVGE